MPKINEDMEKEIIHPRRHPGVVKPRIVSLPAHIIESIRKSVGGEYLLAWPENGRD